MFVPNLDLGSDWENVNYFSAPQEQFNYLHYSDLGFRSDALLVKVSLNIPGVEYKYAGEMFQYWEVAANKYQTRYSKLWLNEQNVVAIEPLASSRLLFKPVGYLHNWTIDIKARPYTVTNNGSVVDFSQVLNRLQTIEEVIGTGFSSNRTDLGEIAANNVEERLTIVTKLNQLDAGIYTLTEGLAEIVSPETGQQLLETSKRRLKLDLGFL